ncbi:hypothetical protein H6P81_016053 [Aristolochia fimbriata]|uniref:Uncharacterized protein n=1 Tax=Aristolochia fimbriata TaxID=158543 RepID=A0AAV7E796_ARIFI|nr:hypothetical protein H6P81_016053 [Aristolochia fimbriata]
MPERAGRGNFWWRPAAIPTRANRSSDLGIGRRLIEPSSSWFPRSFPQDSWSPACEVLSGRDGAAAALSVPRNRELQVGHFGKAELASARDEPKAGLRCPILANLEPTKGVGRLRQQGRWSWKSKSAKECVTTHLPNQLARKMDGFCCQGPIPGRRGNSQASMSREGCWAAAENLGRELRERAVGADLGGSSKYSNENFEGEEGKGSMQGKSAKWIRNGEKDWLEGWARGPSPNPSGCRWTARAAPAGAELVVAPAGDGLGNGPLGAFPANSRLPELVHGQGESDRLIKTKHCDGPADAHAM